MAVRHIPTEIVHQGKKGEDTECGKDTTVKPDHWENTSKSITCEGNGCK